MKKILITLTASILFFIVSWEFLFYRMSRSTEIEVFWFQPIHVVSEYDIDSILYEMVTTSPMYEATKDNSLFLVDINSANKDNDVDSLCVSISWFKLTHIPSKRHCGYIDHDNVTFIVTECNLPIEIVNPGKEWRQFKSNDVAPWFGSNTYMELNYILSDGNFKLLNPPLYQSFNMNDVGNYFDSIIQLRIELNEKYLFGEELSHIDNIHDNRLNVSIENKLIAPLITTDIARVDINSFLYDDYC